ncbi:MAG: serine hydrolase domain-containing protein [Enhygromyxa sp.]
MAALHNGLERGLVTILASLLCLPAATVMSGCRDGYAASDDAHDKVRKQAEPARPRYVETREVITHLANELLRVNEVTGVSLALVDGGEVVWATGFGFANAEHKLPAGPRTVYNVGSLAKPVTAAAVLQAVERGELELEQTLAELLPELELAGDAEQHITLEQLLTHQSGVPSDWFIHDLSESPPPWNEIVEELRGLEPASPPGVHTRYSNLGMTLAGAALERATGRSYEQVVSEALLRPAGMRTAYFPGGPDPEPVLFPIAEGPRGLAAVEHAASYRRNKLRRDPQFRLHPAGGLRASVLDLAAFAGLILSEGRIGNQQLLAPETVAAMLAPHNDELDLDLDHSFGYAWFLDHRQLDGVGRVAWHGGRTYYHHARLIMLPDHDLAVAVASNSFTSGRVVETLAVETLLCALQEKHGIEAPLTPTPIEHQKPPPELLAAWARAHAGEYASSTGISSIGVEDGEAWSRTAIGSSRLTLDEVDGGTVSSIPGARVRFIDEAGHHLVLIERNGVRRATGVLLEPPAPIPPAWEARTGRWTVVERRGEATTIAEPSLRIVNGRLRFEFTSLFEHPPLPVTWVLEPLDDHRARIAGIGRGQGTIVEIRGEGEDQRLWWAGREFRKQL